MVTSRPAFHEGQASAKVRCPGCAYLGIYPVWVIPAAMEDGRDPLFGLPLLLTTLINGELLWAFNLDHVALLEDYLGASLRERATGDRKMTMMARLPRWMKQASNRDRVMQGLAGLRAIASDAGVT